MKQVAVLILLLGASIPAIRAQVVNINCFFFSFNNIYECNLFAVSVPDDEAAIIVIGGLHQAGRNNLDVEKVFIDTSDTPFIITQLFTTFPNTAEMTIWSSRLTRIQSNAFENAHNLRFVRFMGNPLATIHANAFTRASNLRDLDFFDNSIEFIHESAFHGLALLESLYIEQSRISELPPNVFQSLVSLRSLSLSGNSISSIDGRLLANSPQLYSLRIDRNQINAIERTFLDPLPNLVFFNMQTNLCASNMWTIDGSTVSFDTLRLSLATCFDNFDASSWEKQFKVKYV